MLLFYLLVFTLPIPNDPILAYHVGPLTVLKCFGIVCLLVAAFAMIRMGKVPALAKNVRSRWFLLYFFIVVISCFAHDGLSAFGTDPFMWTLSTFSLFLMTTTFVRAVKHVRWAVLVAMGSVAWGSLYVIRQWQKFHNIIPNFRTFGGLVGDPNYYSVSVVLWTPVMIFWLMAKRPRWEKWFCIVCLIPMMLGFIFAGSRGGFLGISGALLFVIWHTKRRMRTFALVGLLMLPVFLAPGNGAVNRLLHPDADAEGAAQDRLYLWEAAENTFFEHPVVGVGIGHYKPYIVRDGQVIYLGYHVAHNTYMELLADLGLFGTIPFILLLLGSIFGLRRITRRSKAPPSAEQEMIRQVALGLQAGLLGYAICAFFLSTLWQQVFWFAAFLAMCLPNIQFPPVAKAEVDETTRQSELIHASA